MAEYTRVTVVGTERRAVVVIPNDETIGAILPGLLDLLQEPSAGPARPVALTRLTGEPLDATRSAAEQALADGELLHLNRLEQSPPPPEVTDVTDAVSESFAHGRDRWDDVARARTGAVAVGLAALAAGSSALGASAPLPALVPVAFAVAALAAPALGLAKLPNAALGALSATFGLLPPTIVVAAPFAMRLLRIPAVPAVVLSTLLLGWLAVLLGRGLAARSRPAAFGAAIGAAGAAIGLALLTAGVPEVRAAAVVAVVGDAAIGLLPWYAMQTSGLTGLDDQVLTEGLTPRPRALVTLERAYRTLGWAAAGVATTIAPALVVLLGQRPGWAFALGIAAGVVVALRTRAFPLTAQVVALWGAVAAGAAAALTALPAASAAAGFAAAAVVVALIAAVRPMRHRRASLRRAGTVLEALAVVALLPLLLGVFDVYPELFGAFR